jgi:AcrR family transcriptional regulator
MVSRARRVRTRTRMDPAEREQQIVQAAVRFFADHGFSGTTRELAARIGVVHGLLYRYFPTKEALLERVYEEVFFKRLKPEWIHWLKDRSVPIRERLVRFYRDYADQVQTYEWVRIYLLAGIAGYDITTRYRALVRRQIIPVVVAETRAALGLRANEQAPLSDIEEDLVYVLHGGVLFIGIRRWVYRSPMRRPNIERLVDVFLAGARELLVKRLDKEVSTV